jgi:hypothetical protein
MKTIVRLLYRAQYCIVVSRHLKEKILQYQYTPSGEFDGIRVLFKDWNEVDACMTTSTMIKNDPHPRELWSLLFEGKLKRSPVDKYLKPHYFSFSLRDLTRRIRHGENIVPQQTRYYKKVAERNEKNHEYKTEADMINLTNKKIELIKNLKEEGQKERVLVNMWNRVLDGGTRTVILKELGYNSVLVSKI